MRSIVYQSQHDIVMSIFLHSNNVTITEICWRWILVLAVSSSCSQVHTNIIWQLFCFHSNQFWSMWVWNKILGFFSLLGLIRRSKSKEDNKVDYIYIPSVTYSISTSFFQVIVIFPLSFTSFTLLVFVWFVPFLFHPTFPFLFLLCFIQLVCFL